MRVKLLRTALEPGEEQCADRCQRMECIDGLVLLVILIGGRTRVHLALGLQEPVQHLPQTPINPLHMSPGYYLISLPCTPALPVCLHAGAHRACKQESHVPTDMILSPVLYLDSASCCCMQGRAMHASRGLNSQTAAPILSGAELKVVPAITRVLVNLEIGGKNVFPLAERGPRNYNTASA